jgi:hypothetical protein
MSGVQKTALLVYFLLLAICIVMIVLSDMVFGPIARGSVLPVATEGFKLVLAALIGAVSAILGTGRSGG